MARAEAALANLREERGRALTGGVTACICGVGMIVGAAYFITQNQPTTTAMAAFAGIGGVITLVLGARILVIAPKVEAAKVPTTPATTTIVEIRAVRITTAHSIDDDANAIILHDGDGRGVYINSHELFEFDENGASYPSTWRLVLTGREGEILSWETSGPRLTAEHDSSPDPETGFDWVQAVVLDDQTPEKWKPLAPSLYLGRSPSHSRTEG
jgi:hypothetical protein